MDLIMIILKIIILAIPAYIIAAAAHESGHIIAGLLNKWRFFCFAAGPITIYRESPEGRIRFALSKDLMSWLGYSATIPAKGKDEDADLFAKVLIGGPIASFVTGLIFLALFLLTRTDICAMTAMIAAAQGISTGLPLNVRSGAVRNDGVRYLDIRKGGKRGAEEKAAFLIAAGSVTCPDCPSDEDLIRTLTDSDDVITRFGGLSYARRNAALTGDKERLASLEAQIALIADKVPESVRNSYAEACR